MKYLLPSGVNVQCLECGAPVDVVESPAPYGGVISLSPCGHETTPGELERSLRRVEP